MVVMRFHRSRVTRTVKPNGVTASNSSSGSGSTAPFYAGGTLVPPCGVRSAESSVFVTPISSRFNSVLKSTPPRRSGPDRPMVLSQSDCCRTRLAGCPQFWPVPGVVTRIRELLGSSRLASGGDEPVEQERQPGLNVAVRHVRTATGRVLLARLVELLLDPLDASGNHSFGSWLQQAQLPEPRRTRPCVRGVPSFA